MNGATDSVHKKVTAAVKRQIRDAANEVLGGRYRGEVLVGGHRHEYDVTVDQIKLDIAELQITWDEN